MTLSISLECMNREIDGFFPGSDLSFFVLKDGRINILHKIIEGDVHETVITQEEFSRIVNFLNDSINAVNKKYPNK